MRIVVGIGGDTEHANDVKIGDSGILPYGDVEGPSQVFIECEAPTCRIFDYQEAQSRPLSDAIAVAFAFTALLPHIVGDYP